MNVVRLGDILKLEYGKPLDQADRVETGLYPAYGANGVKAYTNKFYYEKPSIIVGRKGSAGELTLTNGKFWPLDVTYYIVHNVRVTDLLYIYYLLKTLNLPSMARGVKPGINRNDIYAIQVNLPSLLMQQKIVTKLDAAFGKIDKAIELTENNSIDASHVYDAHLKKLFDIHPDHWVTDKLGDITTKVGSGATPKGGKSSYGNHAISLIRSMNVHDRYFKYDQLAHIDDKQAEKLKNVTLQAGDVLLNITGASVARCIVVPSDCLPGRVNQHVSIIRLNQARLLPGFLHIELISEKYKKLLLGIGDGNGSTRQAITKTQIQNFRVYYPESIEEQHNLVVTARAMQEKSRKLSELYAKKADYLRLLKKSLSSQSFMESAVK